MEDKPIPEQFKPQQAAAASLLTQSVAAKETSDAAGQIQTASPFPESPPVIEDQVRNQPSPQAGINSRPKRRQFLKYAFPLAYSTLITLDRLELTLQHPTAPQHTVSPTPLELRKALTVTLPFLPRINLGQPLLGVKIEDIPPNWYPGAKRAYRFGIHEGADAFTTYGMPILAIADGQVIRSDREFSEIPLALYAHLLAVCKTLHCTPLEIMDRLRGRCLYVDHGITEGCRVVAIYAHLNTVTVEAGQSVKRGQIIATVGNSGTSAGVRGSREGAHLHLELRLQRTGQPETFFGDGMTETEIRQALKEVFAHATT